MENDKPKIGLTTGPRLEIRFVRRGKITEDETLVEKVIKSAKFGEIKTQDLEKSYWVEYPNLPEPHGPFGTRSAAEKFLKELRDSDTDCLGAMGAARIYAVAQGIARRVKTCEREIKESVKLLPQDVRDDWTEGLRFLMEACERVQAQIPYEEIWKAFEQQESDKAKVA